MKHILITGCSSGLGRAAAILLSKQGFRVTATVRSVRDARALEIAAGPAINVIIMDITDKASVDTCMKDLTSEVSTPDILINNAGVPCIGSIEDLNIADFHAAFEVNVIGALRLIQAVVPAMRQRRSGHIINVSSSLGAAALPCYGGYCATKFALEAISESLSYELAPFDVFVNVLRPGLIATPFAIKKGIQIQAEQFATSPYSDQLDSPAPDNLVDMISTPDQVAAVLSDMIQSPAERFRWVCGQDSRNWLQARDTMDDAAFAHYVAEKGYGA